MVKTVPIFTPQWFASAAQRMNTVHAKRLSLACLVACALLLAPRLALAHAHLESSTPAANATVQGPNLAIELRFNSRVDGQRSSLGIEVAGGSGQVSIVHDAQRSENTLNAHAALKPGHYVIQWQALATDGHITRGEIPFTVE
jgi:copper resistance protein C